MEENKQIEKKKEYIWVSFEHEGETIKGYFEKVEETVNYIKVKTPTGTTYTIPYHKLNIGKEKQLNGGIDKK